MEIRRQGQRQGHDSLYRRSLLFHHDALGTQYLDADFSVGILPMPKYDTLQDSYAHVNWGNNIMVPSVVKNKEMVGQVLELMGYYAKTLVRPKYYDDVLGLRASDEPDDRQMVELICDTVVFDPAIAFCDGNDQLMNLVYLPCFALIHQNLSNVTSYYRTNAIGAKNKLERFLEKVP